MRLRFCNAPTCIVKTCQNSEKPLLITEAFLERQLAVLAMSSPSRSSLVTLLSGYKFVIGILYHE